MKYKKIISLLLAFVMAFCCLTGCQSKPGSNKNDDISPSASPTQMSDDFKDAIQLGIAWKELADESDDSITVENIVTLMENALVFLGKENANSYLLAFSDDHSRNNKLQRYELALLLYGVYQDVTANHDFTLSATAIHYEVGGAYKRFEIWDCPDYQEIEELCDYDTTPCNYAICAFDRTTGDKLMALYEDWTFRPAELVTVEDAMETVLHFARSFEEDPVYTDVADDRAAKHTIDPALYTGETTLPNATNQELPNWRGCNISFNSMFAGALSSNPDDVLAEANLDYLKEVGVNFVHIYLSWSYFQGPDHTFDSKVNLSRLEQLDQIISWCMERDIHIQLVFNDVPNLDFNYQESVDDWAAQSNRVFVDASVRDTVTAFWRMLAKRYADIPNNYLSFNLMNECKPADDEQYVWGLGDAVYAIREESRDRVIVADVHAGNPDVTGVGMAELGCALSYHYYNLQDISIVSSEKEAETPGFYESLTGSPSFVNAHIYGPDYWDAELPEHAKGSLIFTGAISGATLSVTIEEISSFDTTIKISAAGKTLYEGMEPYIYDKATDYISVNSTVTVTIPENADSFEITCLTGSCFTMSSISLTLKDGAECSIRPLKDGWTGTKLAEVIVNEDGSCTSTLGLEYVKQNGASLLDLMAVGERYGVDVMVGEFGFFEGGDPMATGIRKEVVEMLLRDQIDMFEKLGLAWCCEYLGRYALATPAPYLEGIEYRALENSPYYVNLEMDEFFKSIMSE